MRSSSARRRNSSAFAALFCALLAPAHAFADDPERSAAAVQKRYDGVKDVRARFVQSTWSAALGAETESRGKMLMRRPGRVRWEYDPPDGRVIVLDDKSLRIYSPNDRQLQIAPVSGASVSPTALGFLMGEGKLGEAFAISKLAATERKELGLELRPKRDSGFESLSIWVDPTSSQLRESVVTDLFGNRTRVRFDEIAENSGIEDAAFTLEVPADVEVIDLR